MSWALVVMKEKKKEKWKPDVSWALVVVMGDAGGDAAAAANGGGGGGGSRRREVYRS